MRQKFIINERWVSDDRRTDIQVTDAIITKPKELYIEIPSAWGKLEEKEQHQIKMIMNYYLQERYNELYNLYIKTGRIGSCKLSSDAIKKVEAALSGRSISEVYNDLQLKIKKTNDQWDKDYPITLDEQASKEYCSTPTQYKAR